MQEIQKHICERIEKIRPNLLDLTRRNPLLSTKFTDRSNSIVRIVDIGINILFESLQIKGMQIVPLPTLEDDPKDEGTKEFQMELADARINNKEYNDSLSNLNDDNDTHIQLIRAERTLKDLLRKELNMPERQTNQNMSVQQHAKINNINPSYDLQTIECNRDTGAEHIQTLLLPDIHERRLNSLDSKDRLCKDESGIHVLHMAFGFLEWKENSTSDSCFAPLILLPVLLSKERTASGLEFSISGQEGSPETNRVLAEKLRLDFGIDLPEYQDQTIDEYLKEIESVSPKDSKWRVRRWAAIGVFPSARLAMYHDLDTLNNWDFANHPIVSTLMVGDNNNSDGTILYGDEYDVDNPDVERKVPLLVSDADSSQFSAIVDVMDGKNLAIEGPPGTGKSQTIVNTIAAALAEGKKVLFVAEKSAALEIVRSRLESCQLGEFLLPLQAQRSNREHVISSVKDRLSISDVEYPDELESIIARFKTEREKLTEYIQVISNKFGQTGLSIYKILGSGIANHIAIEDLPRELLDWELQDIESYSSVKMNEIQDLCQRLDDMLCEAEQTSKLWADVNIVNIDPFKANEITQLCEVASEAWFKVHSERDKLSEFGFNALISEADLDKLELLISTSPKNITNDTLAIAEQITLKNMIGNVTVFLEKARELLKTKSSLCENILNPFDTKMVYITSQLSKFIEKYNIAGIDKIVIEQAINIRAELILNLEKSLKVIEQSTIAFPNFKSMEMLVIIAASDLIHNQTVETLSHRHRFLERSGTKELLERAQNKSKKLRERKSGLEKLFDITKEINKSDLEVHIDSLSNAGLFTFLSSKYRHAKRFYCKISLITVFNLEIALRDLRALKSYIEELERFEKSEKLNTLIGEYFDGIDTNFDCLLEICKLFSMIDQAFPNKEHSPIREFLKFGCTDELLLIPKIANEDVIRKFSSNTYTSILQQIELSKNAIDDISQYLLDINNLTSGFSKLDGWTPDKLMNLSRQIQEFQDIWTNIFKDVELNNIYGAYINNENSNFEFIAETLDIATKISELPSELRAKYMMLVRFPKQVDNFKVTLLRVKDAYSGANSTISKIAEHTGKPIDSWGTNIQCDIIGKNLADAAKDKQGLVLYSRILYIIEEFKSKGLGAFADYIINHKSVIPNISQCFKVIVARSMARAVYKSNGNVLAKYDGTKLTELRNAVARLDRQIIKLYQRKLRSILVQNAKPPSGISGSAKKSEYTEMGLLRHQISLQQRFAKVRDITCRAGNALIELKPCWMMSPLAVAQYIPRDTLIFDLVIIDEASQMRPEDALGAIVRAKQAMIVGDTNQLPPSDFFRKIINDVNEDDDIEDKIVTEESILEIANGVFRPVRQLRWHYRSVYAGLIAFSNKHIYKNNLILFPSAMEGESNRCVTLVKIDGLYSSGTNPKEASQMVEHILQFMIENPTLSLGVVTINQKQRDLLKDEMNYICNQNPVAVQYIEYWNLHNDGLEEFFIKNLENVQGDERDVIFIGTVYGPESPGAKVMQRFGPIAGVSGKRRLNVLFSRAKKHIRTFSSMTAADIQVEEESSNPGAYMLKCWLEYAATGKIDGGVLTNNDTDSEFEDFVIKCIVSMGCEAIPQVGVAGYFVDIGVKHPDWPYGFIMGVECDGASYHSSKSARDRDRLRQEILERRHWYLYRIWSTDWFSDPRRETEKLRKVISERICFLKKNKGDLAII